MKLASWQAKQGTSARIRANATNAIWTHCMIHGEALAAEHISEELHDILKTVISAIKFIKNTPKKLRIFIKKCKDMGSDHSRVLFYSRYCWLSLGNSLSRVYAYLKDENHACIESFSKNLGGPWSALKTLREPQL